ncbi:MAG: hypothetical protein AAF533_12470, partial [Acidobacteriota bacterium]
MMLSRLHSLHRSSGLLAACLVFLLVPSFALSQYQDDDDCTAPEDCVCPLGLIEVYGQECCTCREPGFTIPPWEVVDLPPTGGGGGGIGYSPSPGGDYLGGSAPVPGGRSNGPRDVSSTGSAGAEVEPGLGHDTVLPAPCDPHQPGSCGDWRHGFVLSEHSGEFSIDATDLVVRGLVPDMDLPIFRRYRSRGQSEGSHLVGPGWDGLYNIRLSSLMQRDASSSQRRWTHFVLESGGSDRRVYRRMTSPHYDPSADYGAGLTPIPPDYHWETGRTADQLVMLSHPSEPDGDPHDFELRFRHGSRWLFETEYHEPVDDARDVESREGVDLYLGVISARLSRVSDRNGNTLDFIHHDDGRLKEIVDSRGATTTIAYCVLPDCIPEDELPPDWESPFVEPGEPLSRYHYRVREITDPTGRTVVYDYYPPTPGDLWGVTMGYLKSVTTPPVPGFPDGRTTTYVYDESQSVFSDGSLVRRLLSDNIIEIRNHLDEVVVRNVYDEYGTLRERPDPPPPSHAPYPHFHFRYGFDRVVRQETPTRDPATGALTYHATQHSYEELVVPWYWPKDVYQGGYLTTVTPVKTSYRQGPDGRVVENDFDRYNRKLEERVYTGFVPEAERWQPTTRDTARPDPGLKLRSDDPEAFVSQWRYQEQDGLLSYTTPSGRVTEYSYGRFRDARYRLIYNLATISQGSDIVSFLYDTSDPARPTWEEEYGGRFYNFVTGVGRAVGTGGTASRWTYYEYDDRGNLEKATRPSILDDVTDFEHDVHGRLTAQVLPPNGNGHRRRDEHFYGEDTTSPTWGWLERTVVDAEGLKLTTVIDRDAKGSPSIVTDPKGQQSSYEFNALRELVSQKSPTLKHGARIETRFFHDHEGRLERLEVDNLALDGLLVPELPAFVTRYDRDPLGRVVAESQLVATDDWVTSHRVLDGSGRVIEEWTPLAVSGEEPDAVLYRQHDERGLVLQELRRQERPLEPGAFEELITRFDYDEDGRVSKQHVGWDLSTVRVTEFEFDQHGNETWRRDPMGNEHFRERDVRGNVLVSAVLGELDDQPGGEHNVLLSYARAWYDPADRVRETHEYLFDPREIDGPVTDVAAPHSLGASTEVAISGIERAPNGQVTRTWGPGCEEVLHVPDTANRIVRQEDALGNHVISWLDANGNPEVVQHGWLSSDGTISKILHLQNEHDALDRLVATTRADGSRVELGLDSLSRPLTTTETAASDDPTGRPRFERVLRDGLGRVTETRRTVRDVDEPGGALELVLQQTWDANSRLVGRVDGQGNPTSYEHDAFGQPFRVVHADQTPEVTVRDVFGQPGQFID